MLRDYKIGCLQNVVLHGFELETMNMGSMRLVRYSINLRTLKAKVATAWPKQLESVAKVDWKLQEMRDGSDGMTVVLRGCWGC